MNIIITGHKGLIGSSLKKRLEKEGHNIVNSIDMREGKNILDLKDKYIDEKVDILFHLAAHCKINQSITNPDTSHINDANGTFAVLEFCRKNNIKKIVNFSSSRVISTEKNPYTAAKLYGEELCKAYKDCYNINYIIIRPSTVYGPFDDKTHRLMDIFIRNSLNGDGLVIFGDPETKTLDFSYIDDFIEGIMLAINGPWNNEYDISGGEEFNVYELARLIIQKVSSKSKIIISAPEIAQPQKIKLDLKKIKALGYVPKISLEKGVNKCIDFYKELLKVNLSQIN